MGGFMRSVSEFRESLPRLAGLPANISEILFEKADLWEEFSPIQGEFGLETFASSSCGLNIAGGRANAALAERDRPHSWR